MSYFIVFPNYVMGVGWILFLVFWNKIITFIFENIHSPEKENIFKDIKKYKNNMIFV